MQDISFYLKKFENIGSRKNSIRKAIIEIVKEKSGVELDKDNLDFIRDQIRINITGPAKTEIFINKKRIEEELNNRLNDEFGNKEVVNKKTVF